jgi:phosphatidylglycerophosphatase A
VTAVTISSREERWASRIATLGPVGLCPAAPGTAAAGCTAVALLVLVRFVGVGVWFPVFVLTVAMGQWACGHLPERWGKDPRRVVIDEVAGQAVAVAFLPPSVGLYLVAFLLFRLFDVWKPGPIRWLDTRGGSWAVMGDDLVAGVAARGILGIIQVM